MNTPKPATVSPDPFLCFEERVRLASERHPEMPGDLVVLSRLYAYIFRRTEIAFDTLMARWNLTASSWLAMIMVYSSQNPELTPSDLSRSLSLARANVTRVTDELVRRGLMTRQTSAADRRVLELTLTDEGNALVQLIMPHAWDLHRAIWSQLTENQLDSMRPLLFAILQGIESWPGTPRSDLPAESK